MWLRFTVKARQTVFRAKEEAQQWGENYVSTEHLLLGVLHQETSVAGRMLQRAGVSVESIRSELLSQMTRGDGFLGGEMQLTLRSKNVIDLAYEEARQLGNNYIGTEHLLLGMLREEDGLAGRVLRQTGADLERIRDEVKKLLNDDNGATDLPN